MCREVTLSYNPARWTPSSQVSPVDDLCDEIITICVMKSSHASFHAANSEAVSPLEWKVVGGDGEGRVGGNGICKWLHNELVTEGVV